MCKAYLRSVGVDPDKAPYIHQCHIGQVQLINELAINALLLISPYLLPGDPKAEQAALVVRYYGLADEEVAEKEMIVTRITELSHL